MKIIKIRIFINTGSFTMATFDTEIFAETFKNLTSILNDDKIIKPVEITRIIKL
ncbi:hypothetical protein [Enterococcus faecalis]|uniref:hypothetical protein n=1 Tax=Enterococcus faecalis TaxID=1351 RepID=UPI0001F0B606|nr:hypothetical protein [Enterococcus faecalis]EFT45771.1 hypothetical protein HMPREF9500_00194 [Enterococcus faecalis TX0017]